MAKRVIEVGVIILAGVVIGELTVPGVDFYRYFYPGFRSLLMGDFTHVGVYNAPWFWLLFPFGFLPVWTSWGIWAAMNGVAYYVAIMRIIEDRAIGKILLASGFAWLILGIGNIDGLVLLGATLPPAIGVWLLMLKPHLGIWVVMVWVIREGFWKSIRMFSLPVILYGIWIIVGMVDGPVLGDMFWNISLFPYTFALGLLILVDALWLEDERWALLGGLLITPYLAAQSLIMGTVWVKTKRAAVGVVVISWIFVIVRNIITGRIAL